MIRKSCFAYTRVSTVKQGDGVSLEAQRDAITVFAQRNNLTITDWFEEKETAAKRGRPVFDKVVRSLQAGQAAGLVVHKIDRSARNFADWARIGDLVDSGIDVHFAHESLDLRSRGGRLTADIQAVIAADYVRNLREECIKGMEGRLKQGLFPWAAPIGYLDQGGGKAKIPDPKRAPLVREAFELYASGQYSFKSLLGELQKRGLTNRHNQPITKGCLENMMSNPFYTGVVLLKRTGRRYLGKHEPIVPLALFNRVQDLKSGKQVKKSTLHNHPYRQLISCATCDRSLIGEQQKAHVYYRCHTQGCAKTSIRQDVFEQAIHQELLKWRLGEADQKRLEHKMQAWLEKRTVAADQNGIQLQLANVAARKDRLTDALLEQLIDKQTFQERKITLDQEEAGLEEALGNGGDIDRSRTLAQKYLELMKSLVASHGLAGQAQKARLVQIAMSNCSLAGKELCLQPYNWLCRVEDTLSTLCGAPVQDRNRTEVDIEGILSDIANCNTGPEKV
jgi:site-specific DNA recombinase